MVVSSILALLGHLFNQGMTHELLSLQLLTILLDGDPTDDSVDVAVGYMCIVGKQLTETSPKGVRAIMERFRGLLHEGTIGRRGQYRIETLLKIQRGGFVEYPTLPDEEYLDLVEREDQITFEMGLDDEGLDDGGKEELELDYFGFDEEYDEREREWGRIRAEILGEDSDDDSCSGGGESSGSDDDDESESSENDEKEENKVVGDQELGNDKKKTVAIQDLTETDLVHLRRTIYLTIMSSATFEECTHKLAKMDIPQGRESELINMIIECCSQERTFLRYYGLVSGRFCLLHERWQDAFESAFATQYNTIHRLETNKLRNVAKLFGHLLHTDSISWSVLSCIHLNEDETTSSSRIFIKILVQEMAEAMGMGTLKQRFDTDNPDPDGLVVANNNGGEETITALAIRNNNANPDAASAREWFKGMFPKDNARNTRYAINFFTSIGLGPLTDGMREFLKNAPKLILAQAQEQAAREAAQKMDDSDASSVISSSSSDTSSFDSSSSSSSFSSSSSSSSYSSSSYSSYSSDSRRRKRSRRRDGGRKRRGRSRRSYSSSSSSDSDSDESSRSGRGRRKSSSKGKRNSRRSRSPSNGSSVDKKRSADKNGNKTADVSKTSSKRSVSQSPAGSRANRNRRRRSRSYSSSPSRSRSYRKSKGERRSRSSENPIHELPPELKERQKSRRKRRRRSPSSSSSSASQSRSPSREKKYARRKDRNRGRSRSQSASSRD